MLRYTLAFALCASTAQAQALFPSPDAAQAHCPHDTVVWLNTTRHIYRMPGEKGYGKSKSSSYACMAEAEAAGAKAKKVKPPAATGAPAPAQ